MRHHAFARRHAPALLAVIVLFGTGTGCLWKVPSYIRSFFALNLAKDKDAASATAKPGDGHLCGCRQRDEDEPIIDQIRCDADGSYNPRGRYLCCARCSLVCFGPVPGMGAESDEAECPLSVHCADTSQEGDGEELRFRCKKCNKICSLSDLRSKPPGPVPIPRRCPADSHCQRVTKCPIGEAGDCCAGKGDDKGCGQPCPPWSGAE